MSIIGSDYSFLLAINAGSSSIKASLYIDRPNPICVYEYVITLIGTDKSTLTSKYADKETKEKIKTSNHLQALNIILNEISRKVRLIQINRVGHRVVHGGLKYNQPTKITVDVMKYLTEISPLAPEHLPTEIKIINYSKTLLSKANHYAVFDTAFFCNLPPESYTIPIKSNDKLIRKYGFHGMSYQYSLNYISKKYPRLSRGKLVIAHLGSGSSLAAIENKIPIDTTMSFSPASGVMMSTRSGDIDPGILVYLQKSQNLSPNKLNNLINHESGLLSVSNKSAEMEQLIKNKDEKSQLAVKMYCNQIAKTIGSYAALMNGIDAVIFSGGIGENAPVIRSNILSKLNFLGINVDNMKNDSNNEEISITDSKAKAIIVKTNEQEIIIKSIQKAVA